MCDKPISSIYDRRLILIDTSIDGFFDVVLNYPTKNKKILKFQENVKFYTHLRPTKFWKPIYDPSIEYDDERKEMVAFKEGNTPAIGYTYEYWEEVLIPKMNSELFNDIRKRYREKWEIGKKFHYYVFLVWLINRLVSQEGWKPGTAIKAVVINSNELGVYSDSSNDQLAKTGSKEICGVCDVGNTSKYIYDSWRTSGIAGGHYLYTGKERPLAHIEPGNALDEELDDIVPFLIIK